MNDTLDGSSSAAHGAQEEDPPEPGFFARMFGAKPQKPLSTDPQNTSLDHDSIVHFPNLRVSDVAIPRADIVAVEKSSDLKSLIATFKSSGFSRLPVYDENLDNPMGMVHLKDVALKYGFNGRKAASTLKSVTRPVIFVPPSMPLSVLLQKMQTERTHMALVIDEYGGVDGLVTIEDLVEQIVGEIDDEHDAKEEAAWVEESPGIFSAQARASLEEFEQVLGIDLASDTDDEEIDTLGGLVFMLAGRVPARGEVISHPAGYEFEILDADPRRINRLRVCKRVST